MSPFNGTKQAPKHLKWLVLWLGSLALMGIGVVVFLGAVLTYEPYKLERYAIKGNTFCPSEETFSTFGANAKKPVLGSITLIANRWEWVNRDGTVRIPGQTFVDDFNGEYGQRNGTSKRVRYAPTIPGEWRVDSTFEVRGFQLLKREIQLIPHVETQFVTVLDPSAPRCLVASLP